VLGFAALAIVVAYFMTSIEEGVLILFNLQAAVGLVLMLRWLWWRVNAWSEISAMISSLVVTVTLPFLSDYFLLNLTAADRILVTVVVVTPIWLAATFLTAPVDWATLDAFYRRVRPISTYWRPIALRCPEIAANDSIRQTAIGWLAGAVGVISLSFTIGKVVLLQYGDAAWTGAICLAATGVLWWNYRGKGGELLSAFQGSNAATPTVFRETEEGGIA
jgi:hypothetical protein